jgi:tRNA(adenine34) deaminase
MSSVRRNCPFPKIHSSFLNQDDAFFMTLAYNQAIEAWREDEVPVGAVIVRAGEVIASAHNGVETQCDPTAHAEMLAITQAASHAGGWRLNGCTLYVTKEPCPMCSGAAIMSRLERVVYAWGDPKMGCLGGATSVHELPRLNHRLSVEHGILEPECKALLQAYFAEKREEVESMPPLSETKPAPFE